ncbi:MAG: VTT domain-containing protein [Gemmatimonadaceae bacterium]
MTEPARPSVEVNAFVRREIWLALLFTVLLMAAVGLAGIYLRDEITGFAGWIYHTLGFPGLALIFFVSETVVSPMPPDVILLIVAGSELRESWHSPVLLLALLSTVGGHAGWLLGNLLAGTGLVRRILGRHHGLTVELTRRYGAWAVVLAAITPLPWSVSSWTAGALHMPWRLYLLGSLARAPRIVVAYILIHAAYHRVVTPLIG